MNAARCAVPGCYRPAHARGICNAHRCARDRYPDSVYGREAARYQHPHQDQPRWVCDCDTPHPNPIPLFPGAVQCGRCHRPPADTLNRNET